MRTEARRSYKGVLSQPRLVLPAASAESGSATNDSSTAKNRLLTSTETDGGKSKKRKVGGDNPKVTT